jgi:UDP:flavonoid glycosyltransferase YjiC (YdhE family)
MGGDVTTLIVAWPEPGHVAAPMALAKRLRASGERVVFAGHPWLARLVDGFDVVDLSASGRSVFVPVAGPASLPAAVDATVEAFGRAVDAYQPTRVFVDTLYSPIGLLAEVLGIPWAQYEIDLPHEYDPMVPPPGSTIVPSERTYLAIADAWAAILGRVRGARLAEFGWSAASWFPAALLAELQRRTVLDRPFCHDSAYPPVAIGVPRLLLCPAGFDFPRSRTEDLVYAGTCIDWERREVHFPWTRLPADRPVVYCSLGTQSARSAGAATRILATVLEAFRDREEFLVVACPPAHAVGLAPDPARAIVVPKAPQLAMLQRSSVCLTHAGINTVRECAALGVPMVAVPLSHDQPRNAALVEYHGIGVAISRDAATPAVISQAVTTVQSPRVRANCDRVRAMFQTQDTEVCAPCAIDLGATDTSTT